MRHSFVSDYCASLLCCDSLESTIFWIKHILLYLPIEVGVIFLNVPFFSFYYIKIYCFSPIGMTPLTAMFYLICTCRR